jgi:hypothetical protein
MSRNDIMHEYDNHWGVWPPLLGTLRECKTHKYVAIIEGLNHRLERVPRDYKEITLIWQ